MDRPHLGSRPTAEPEVEGSEHQDDPDVHHQPWPEVMPEEEDVDENDHRCHSQHREHDSCRSLHEAFLARPGGGHVPAYAEGVNPSSRADGPGRCTRVWGGSAFDQPRPSMASTCTNNSPARCMDGWEEGIGAGIGFAEIWPITGRVGHR